MSTELSRRLLSECGDLAAARSGAGQARGGRADRAACARGGEHAGRIPAGAQVSRQPGPRGGCKMTYKGVKFAQTVKFAVKPAPLHVKSRTLASWRNLATSCLRFSYSSLYSQHPIITALQGREIKWRAVWRLSTRSATSFRSRPPPARKRSLPSTTRCRRSRGAPPLPCARTRARRRVGRPV